MTSCKVLDWEEKGPPSLAIYMVEEDEVSAGLVCMWMLPDTGEFLSGIREEDPTARWAERSKDSAKCKLPAPPPPVNYIRHNFSWHRCNSLPISFSW